jgi:putative endonuclease
MQETSYVYILASGFKHLYIGVTTELELRVLQHKNNAYPNSFTSRNNIKDLVYFERFGDLISAITREKQLSVGLASRKLLSSLPRTQPGAI